MARKTVSFKPSDNMIDKMDALSAWLDESRSGVLTRAVYELYAREAEKRGVEPYPEVDRTVEYPSYSNAS